MKEVKDTADNTITAHIIQIIIGKKQNIKKQYANCYKLHTFTKIKNPTRHDSKTGLCKNKVRN